MKEKQVSIALQTDKTAAAYISLARLIGKFEFDIVSVYCDAPYHPSYGPLLLMAPYLKSAQIGPAAVSPFRIHPIDIAANTALLASLAQSGVYIGLARGAWLNDHGIKEPRQAIQGMREAIHIIQSLLRGESAGIDGQIFNISESVRAPYPLPEQEIPLMVGTWGPKLAEMAGEIADEVKIGGTANPDMVGIIRGAISKGEIKANRLMETVQVVIGSVTVVDEDRQLARAKARREVALYLPVVARLDPTLEIEEERIQRIRNAADHNDHEAASDLISDDLLNLFAFSGTPADIITQASRLYEAGAGRVEFGTPHGLDPGSGIRLLGEKVVPELKKRFDS